MDNTNYFILTPQRRKSLIENAVIVFDTCALCNMYFMTPNKLEIMVNVLRHFKNRIWLPAQVAYEYSKNRIKSIKNPINERYNNIVGFTNSEPNVFSQIETFLQKMEKQIDEHPFIDEDKSKSIENNLKQMKAIFDEIMNTVKEQLATRKKEILFQVEQDKLHDVVNEIEKGQPFTHSEVMNIMREGEFRYRNNFPPGYKDSGGSKKGSQIYGDLIFWKEIIRYAKDNKKSILLVTDDKKEDWYEDNTEHNPIKPRSELIKEFQDETKQDIWIFTLKSYIEILIDHYKDRERLPFFDGLEELKESIAYQTVHSRILKSNESELMLVRCDKCSECVIIESDNVDWDWVIVSSEERNMGVESIYECTHHVKCQKCTKEIIVNFRVCEYPSGIYNGSEIKTEGGKVVKEFNLQNYIDFFEDEDYSVCLKCGKYDILNANGFCDECNDSCTGRQ